MDELNKPFQVALDEAVLGFEKGLFDRLGHQLIKANMLLSVTEGVTGGYITEQLSKHPFINERFCGGIVCPNNMALVNLGGIAAKTISELGPSHEKVGVLLAEQCQKRAMSKIALSTVGGINKESQEGFVWTTIIWAGKQKQEKISLDGQDEDLKIRLAHSAVLVLSDVLKSIVSS